jgi:DNA-binding transcriptional LysR family regulator
MHHPVAEREAVALADLGQEPFIMFPRSVGTGLFDIIVTACRDAGFTPRVVQEAPQFTSIIGLVSADLGVALIPSALAQIRLDGVVYRPLLGAEVSAPVLLVARRRDASAAVAAFVKMARTTDRQHSPPGM